jgi:cysteine desulfurase family protein (TIGR01976 family)
VERIRALFPALERRQAGLPVAYFDGPGGTQVPRAVADAVSDYLLHHNANTKWAYATSTETDAVVDAARHAAADFLGAEPGAIAFGGNMTTLTFHLSRALSRAWGPGDEIVVTQLDHHANVAPWTEAARDRGLTVRTVRMRTEDGTLDWDDLATQLSPRTKLVAVGAASNTLGTITDVARAARMARAVGALSFVDAVHYAAHELVDVAAIGCDFLACSPYKFYGPHMGILCTRSELAESLDVPRLRPAPNETAARLETGTGNFEAMAGLAAAVNFLAELAEDQTVTRRERLARGYHALADRELALTRRLWDGLSAIGGVTLYGPPPGQPRTATLSFTVADHSSREVAAALATRGLFLSNGDFYASTIAERYDVKASGFVRAGCVAYTTAEEVDRLVEAVREISGKRDAPELLSSRA